MKLYDYWRSSASYRLRIALALKGLTPERAFVHLVKNGGEHRNDAYRAVNPQRRVPSLALHTGDVLIQSPAIIEYLEETHPTPPLLPHDPVMRAKIRAVAAIIGCDMHPLHNSSPLAYLRNTLKQDEAAVTAWITHWMTEGFAAIEALIDEDHFCFGAEPGLADVFLVPQVFGARRFNIALDAFPKVLRVDAFAVKHPAFAAAHPNKQPDAEVAA